MRILIVSSVGGHLQEVMTLAPAFEGHDVGLVLNDRFDPPPGLGDWFWQIPHGERDLLFGAYFLWAWRIVRSFRPRILVSAGAGHAVPFALIARLHGAKVIFLETMTAVSRPSVSGRLVYPLSHLFLYQWEELRAAFPRGRYVGPIW
jgi:UDP-N-acetylglucosamine:LPS N-acetylglucosamine transferase